MNQSHSYAGPPSQGAAAAQAAPMPKAPPTTPAVRAEDDQAAGEGSSIDTFCDYQPTALPRAVLELCNSTGESQINKENEMKTRSADIPKTNAVVIDLQDDEESMKDGANPDTKSKSSSKLESAEANEVEPPVPLTVPSHTSPACESALLSSVQAPPVHPDTAGCLFPLLAESPGSLSPLQLEGVLLAIQRHRRIFTASGERAGFFIGDGAGIGKGRQISAILRDSLCRQDPTKRHVWLSVSRELIQDARRDLRDTGVHCDVHDGTVLLDSASGLGKKDKGVLFLTYPLLVSANRLEQIVEWCAGTDNFKKSRSEVAKAKIQALEATFSGCIVFDEAHKAKNLANDTRTAQLVLQLQRRLPKARVVYCSATGVSDVAHLAYAERLGLWNTTGVDGNMSNFSDFTAFRASLEQRGLGSLELLALELKQQGSFLARTLSWEGAEFQTTTVTLTAAQEIVYDAAVIWWTRCKIELEKALNVSGTPPGTVWRNFWSAHQRFFKELAICAKIPSLAKEALQQIQQHNRCVVIGLQSTGDAGMQSLLQKFKKSSFEGKRFPCLLSTVAAGLTNFILYHFPVAPPPPTPPKLPSNPPPDTASIEEIRHYAMIQAEIARVAGLPPSEPIPELVQTQQALLHAVQQLNLPPNPLDDLIERLGGVEYVAEMTGRSGRMTRACSVKDRNQKLPYFVYSKRAGTTSNIAAAAAQEDSERINLVERRQFMDGTKPVAIISDAASTGISLHSARGSAASHKRRVHYTIELPWSADKAVQQLGRSHRSGQESAPIYKLVVTNLGGERRFAAAVSKRMASLGALTKGDRRAATGSDMLSEFDLDSRYGKRALKRFFNALEHNLFQQSQLGQSVTNVSLPCRDAGKILDQFANTMVKNVEHMGVTLSTVPALRYSLLLALAAEELDQVGLDRATRNKADVRIFLNRLSGLTVSTQTLIFSLFMSTLGDVIKEAKASGEFEGSAEDLRATSITIGREHDLAVDPSSGAQTKLTTLVLDRGIALEVACSMAIDESQTSKPREDSSEAEKSDHLEKVAEVVQQQKLVDNADTGGDDGWIAKPGNKRQKKVLVGTPGFYISRNRIAGRNLTLFAKCKFDRSSFKTEEEAAAFDPLGLMVITRPNTGTNLTDMTTKDLETKYQLAIGCDKLKRLLVAAQAKDAATEIAQYNRTELIKRGNAKIADLWTRAYEESDSTQPRNGLANRRAEVALVTGPVLHVLPALEKAVMLRSTKDRSLKIMRAQVGTRRIVGVRFPADEEAFENLEKELEHLRRAKKVAGNAFTDEDLSPISTKNQEWATSERKTIKSFFRVKGKSDPEEEKSLNATNTVPSIGKTQKAGAMKRVISSAEVSASSTKRGKTSSIASFFASARKY